MSRTRIVGGSYTKIIEGNYYLNSTDEISIISGGKYSLNARDGINYGEPKNENDSTIKEIISVEWISITNNDKISKEITLEDKVSILVKTKNYQVGEFVKLSIKNTFNDENVVIDGVVNEEGEVFIDDIKIIQLINC